MLASISGVLAQYCDSDSVVLKILEIECSTMPVTYNNDIKLFVNGTAKFEDMFAEIAKAKHHVHLDYFNFRNDSIGNALFNLLAAKVQEGVEVRAIFDAFGNSSNSQPLKKKHLKQLRARGIQIHKFKPARFPYIDRFFNRDHRKIVVIDGRIAYMGGINVADYYIKGLPEIGDWRDVHIRIEGGAVAQLQNMFLKLWNKSTKQNIDGEQYFLPVDTAFSGDKTMIIIDRTPNETPEQMRCAYAVAIREAQKSIKIINPYFLPTHKVKKELKKAIKRGINVEIMIPAKSDIPFTPDGSIYVAHSLMKRGAEVFLFEGGFHHSKIMMVDSLFCTVGSANLDSRSLRYDYEVNTFIFNREITDSLTQIFENDKLQCVKLTPEIWKKRSCWKKFTGWFARLLTPFL
ncbi:MAG: cardiolipin synthase [Prevotellaceae bacterium]|nr:cardiolipin synthase [Prevotellaceae bacterium]